MRSSIRLSQKLFDWESGNQEDLDSSVFWDQGFGNWSPFWHRIPKVTKKDGVEVVTRGS